MIKPDVRLDKSCRLALYDTVDHDLDTIVIDQLRGIVIPRCQYPFKILTDVLLEHAFINN